MFIEIHAGEGGQDAKLFIHDMAHAYRKYAQRSGLEGHVISCEESCITLEITGKNP